MPKVANNMDNKSEDLFILMIEEIENNKQEMKAEMKDIKEEMEDEMKDIKETPKTFATLMMNQTNISKSSLDQKDTSTPPEPATVVPTNRRDSPLEGGQSTKIGGMWTLKHVISSPKFYELLIKS